METANCIRAPKQLDETFFANALENGLREQGLSVKNVLLTLGNEKSDSYCALSFRFFVYYAKRNQFDPDYMYLIVKTYSEQYGATDANIAFNKEKCFFVDVLPQLEILFNDVKFSPNCYYATKDPIKACVFEDLGERGFTMAHRDCGLDEDHTKFVLKKLAQFHAASMVFAKMRPTIMNNFRKRSLVDRVFINQWTFFHKTVHRNLGFQIKLVSTWEGFEKITKKLQEYHDNFETRVLASIKCRDDEIKVLNHGFLDMDNILCKYDPPYQLVDVEFIEFGMSFYGSLGIDLNGFLFESVNVEVLKKWKLMIEVYHASLCYTLMELGYDGLIPTYEDVEKEFVQNFTFGLFTLIGPAALANMDKKISDGNNFGQLAKLDRNVEAEEIFMSPTLIERLRYSLLEFDKVGALD